MRGADLLVRTLVAHGVRTVFTLSGNHIMSVFDALVDHDIRLVHVRHEAAAVHMAEAWAQISGEIGIVLVTAGPGFANALSALSTARASETPILFMSGDVPRGQRGFGGFQEMDQTAMAAPVVKDTRRIEAPEDLGLSVAASIAAATDGRPGPVHLVLPEDVLRGEITGDLAAPGPLPGAANPVGGDALDSIAAHLASAARPLVLAGPQFCRHGHASALDGLSAASGSPVIPMESPRGLKDPSKGHLRGVVERADFVLLLGKALDFTLGFGRPPAFDPGCVFAQIDPDRDMIERSRRLLGSRFAVAVEADACASIAALADAARDGCARHEGWRADVAAALALKPENRGNGDASGSGMHPGVLSSMVAEILTRHADPIVICDGGEFGQWVQALVPARRRIINGPNGGIGAAIPHAVGACLADPDATVIAFAGDGAAGFHISEFDTALRENTAFVTIVGNDSRWNAEYQIQEREYGPDRAVGCELRATRYDAVAAGFGAQALAAHDRDTLAAALDEALASGQPACINVTLAGQPAPDVER